MSEKMLRRFGQKSVKLKDNHRFILSSLYRDQPLSRDEQQEKLVILASKLGNASRTRELAWPRTQLEEGLDKLQQHNYVALNDDGNYTLTEEGEEIGRLCVESLEKGARFVRKLTERFLTLNAVAKVNILIDFVLAVMKRARTDNDFLRTRC